MATRQTTWNEIASSNGGELPARHASPGMRYLRRIRVITMIAILFWAFLIAKMAATGDTGGQIPLTAACLLLIAYAVWVNMRTGDR